MYDDSDIFNLNEPEVEFKSAAWKDPYDYKGEPWLKWLGRLVGTGAASVPTVLGVPGSLAEFAASKVAGHDVNIPYLPTMDTFRKTRQAFAENYLPDKDYLEPQDLSSKIASYIGGDIPFLVASGGSGLLKSLASSATMGGLDEAGAPPLLQMLGGMGASGAIDYARRGGLAGSAMKAGQKKRLFGVDTLTDFAERTKHSAYEEAGKLGNKFMVDAEPLEDFMISTLDVAQRRLSKVEYNALKDEINTLSKDILLHKINGQHVLDANAKFNRLAGDAYHAGKKELGKQYELIGDHIRNVIGQASEAYPEYGKMVDLGRQTMKNLNEQGKLRGWLEKSTALDRANPLTKLVLLGTGGITGALVGGSHSKPMAALGTAAGTAAGYGAGVFAREIARTVDLVSKNPAIKNHLKKIMFAVGKDQMKQLPFLINKLDKEIVKHVGNGMPYTLEDVD